jgi:hypothetical protein
VAVATDPTDQDVLTPEAIAAQLQELVQTPGWQLLIAQADREWGPRGYGCRMQEALTAIPQGPDRPYQLAQVAEQVDATARAVQQILGWPQAQIRMIATRESAPRRFAAFRRSPVR